MKEKFGKIHCGIFNVREKNQELINDDIAKEIEVTIEKDIVLEKAIDGLSK